MPMKKKYRDPFRENNRHDDSELGAMLAAGDNSDQLNNRAEVYRRKPRLPGARSVDVSGNKTVPVSASTTCANEGNVISRGSMRQAMAGRGGRSETRGARHGVTSADAEPRYDVANQGRARCGSE